ncbi:MAG: hypothetical protein K0S08_327 [Gammaproteobacteria bacterium]|jgi:hypothetical protein|nr:hypothetical protein [Gammaproteobacteria bacterium]
MFKKMPTQQKLALEFMWQMIKSHVANEPFVIRIDFEKIDQHFFEMLLKEHRLYLIAYPLLKNFLPASHPFLLQLHKKNFELTFRHLQQKKSLIQITKEFEANEIAYVALKGPALNDLLYGNHCLRQSNDLDILITPQDALKTHAILKSLNYQVAGQQFEKGLIQYPEQFPKHVKDIAYLSPEKILLELHYRSNMIKEVGVQFSSKHEIKKLNMMDQTIHILSAEENLLYLCLHGAKHHWARLQWLIDLASFVQKIPLNWDKVLKLACETHCLRPLLEVKILLKNHFNLALPNFNTSWQDRLAVYQHLKYVKARWQLIEKTTHRFYNNLRGVMIDSLLYSHWQHKLKFIQNTALSHHDPLIKLQKQKYGRVQT